MNNKVQFYLQAGAEEVWIIWEDGIVDYYGKMGKMEKSGYGVSVKLSATNRLLAKGGQEIKPFAHDFTNTPHNKLYYPNNRT